MQFQLSKSGTVTECREALNAAIAALPLPYDTEHAVVRAIANHVVVSHLDPLHDPWAKQCNVLRAGGDGAEALRSVLKLTGQQLPAEPTTTVLIDCTIIVGGVAAKV